MSLITDHPAVFTIMAYWIFSAIIGGMPAPTESDSKGYTWVHDSLHILAGNLTAAIAQRYPQLPAGTQKKTYTEEQIVVPPTNKEQ